MILVWQTLFAVFFMKQKAKKKKTKIEPKPKVYAFIDSQNLNLGIKGLGWELDFCKFLRYLENKYKVAKAFLFIGYIASNKKLYKYLKECGYQIIFKKTVAYWENGRVNFKGNVDADLVLHAMIQYKNYDKSVMVSGDGDFQCLIDYWDKNNKLYKIFVPDYRIYSSLLLPYKKYIIFGNYLKQKLSYIEPSKKNKTRG